MKKVWAYALYILLVTLLASCSDKFQSPTDITGANDIGPPGPGDQPDDTTEPPDPPEDISFGIYTVNAQGDTVPIQSLDEYENLRIIGDMYPDREPHPFTEVIPLSRNWVYHIAIMDTSLGGGMVLPVGFRIGSPTAPLQFLTALHTDCGPDYQNWFAFRIPYQGLFVLENVDEPQHMYYFTCGSLEAPYVRGNFSNWQVHNAYWSRFPIGVNDGDSTMIIFYASETVNDDSQVFDDVHYAVIWDGLWQPVDSINVRTIKQNNQGGWNFSLAVLPTGQMVWWGDANIDSVDIFPGGG